MDCDDEDGYDSCEQESAHQSMQSLSFKVLREAVEQYEVNVWKARFVVPVE